MNDRWLIERLSAEIQRATDTGDRFRARRLAALQREVLTGMSRDMASSPSEDRFIVPLPRPVPEQEKAG